MSLPKINHPVFDVKIPSQGKTIQVKQMLARDDKILLMAKASSGDPIEQQVETLKAIKQVINNCIVTPGIDVDSLAYFDIEWLFIKLRQYSVTNKAVGNYEDYEEFEDWAKKLQELGQSLDEVNQGAVPKIPRPEPHKIEIDLEKVEVKFPENQNKVIKVDDYISLEMKYPDASLYSNEAFLRATGADMLDMLIKNSIVEIREGDTNHLVKDVSAEELSTFLNELPMGVYDKVQEFLNNMPNVFYEIKYTNRLGHERKITLNKLSDFFSF